MTSPRCPCCGQHTARLRCQKCVSAGEFSRSRRRATMHVLSLASEDYVVRNLRLEVSRRLREVAARASVGEAEAEVGPARLIDSLARAATMTYAHKRVQLEKNCARISELATEVGSAVHAQGVEALRTEREAERTQARVETLRAALEHEQAEANLQRNRVNELAEAITTRHRTHADALEGLRSEREMLRSHRRGAAPPVLPPVHRETIVREKRGRIKQLVTEYGLTPKSICGIALPPDGNFLRPTHDPATIDLGLFHTTRFLEVTASLLCLALPFSCSDIGFPYDSGPRAGVDEGSGWHIDIKAQKVNYNICALFEADGMDVAQLQPEPGAYFQTLPNLVRCTDPDTNPTLGTLGPLLSGRPLGQVIEGPVGEDFVLL
eukprot:m.113102 g.113102  ORF g.113102 m.113102 type:complete len:378 (+) comp13006_c0_seq2:392-1525(+)